MARAGVIIPGPDLLEQNLVVLPYSLGRCALPDNVYAALEPLPPGLHGTLQQGFLAQNPMKPSLFKLLPLPFILNMHDMTAHISELSLRDLKLNVDSWVDLIYEV